MYYGCDSGSNHFPCAADFYIGRVGYGVTRDYTYFNASAANRVGAANTYAYWFVEGPDAAGATNNDAAYNWGQRQADAAHDARLAAPAPISRVTVFGDFEGFRGQNGWSTNVALNQKVWQGFFNQMAHNVLSAGVYSTATQWNDIMNAGAGFGIPPGTSIWSADDTDSSGSNGPVPCDGCPSSFPSLPLIGGITPVIWQYNQNNGSSPTCPADLDAATRLP